MSRIVTLLFLAFALALTGCATIETGKSFRELAYPFETSVVNVDGVEIAYTSAGSGPTTLLFIHGLGSYMPVWKQNLPALQGQFRVVAIDLPGYGRSAKANYHYSMDFFARAVEGVIRELQLHSVVLVGHSMGAQIAITHALKYPNRARALALLAPAGLEEFGRGEGRWLSRAVSPDFIKAATPKAIFVNLARNFYRMPQDAHFMAEDRMAIVDGPDFDAYAYANSRSVAAMIDGPVHKRLGEVQVPVLVIYGEADGLIPNPALHGGETADVAQEGAAKFKNAQLVIIENAGHMVQFEAPDQVNAALSDFATRLAQ
jgi:pimeloyl-ACP methyl ester carboxylesterase